MATLIALISLPGSQADDAISKCCEIYPQVDNIVKLH